MNWLSPALWNNIGVVTVVVFIGIAVARGWLIPKSLHREIIGEKDRTISDLRGRAVEDAATMKLQAETISKHDGADVAAIRLLQATRNAVGDS